MAVVLVTLQEIACVSDCRSIFFFNERNETFIPNTQCNPTPPHLLRRESSNGFWQLPCRCSHLHKWPLPGRVLRGTLQALLPYYLTNQWCNTCATYLWHIEGAYTITSYPDCIVMNCAMCLTWGIPVFTMQLGWWKRKSNGDTLR